MSREELARLPPIPRADRIEAQDRRDRELEKAPAQGIAVKFAMLSFGRSENVEVWSSADPDPKEDDDPEIARPGEWETQRAPR